MAARAQIAGECIARLAEFARDCGDEDAQTSPALDFDDHQHSSTACCRAEPPDGVAELPPAWMLRASPGACVQRSARWTAVSVRLARHWA
jgi:hypothetical protein